MYQIKKSGLIASILRRSGSKNLKPNFWSFSNAIPSGKANL